MAAEAKTEYRMVLVVNSSLKKMGVGKACAQVGHAVAHWSRVLEAKSTPDYQAWKDHLEPKIVLKATEEEMIALHKAHPSITHMVVDAGFTQIPSGSKTVLGFAPMAKDKLPVQLQALKLL